MSLLRTTAVVAATATTLVAVPATADAAKRNPYTAAGVCGAGYKPIDRKRLVDSNVGKLLAETVLTYNAATGRNCVVTLKRHRIGLAQRYRDNLRAELYTRPLRTPGNVASDQGNYKFYAGPVYVPARGKCVQWGGGADLIYPANHTPRGTYHANFRSGWTRCR